MEFLSRQEVLRHNKISDCWIIIRNSVYDVTSFLKKHPGGADILMARAGEDATSYFITKHGLNKNIRHYLEKLKIGELHLCDRITANDFEEPFLMELLEKCHEQKLYKNPGRFTNPYFWMRLVNISLFFTLSFIALYGLVHPVISVAAVLLQAVIGTSLFGFVAHEDTHRFFLKSAVMRSLLRISWPVFWPFIPQGPLRYEHNSHHIKIGDPEFDYEVAAFASFLRYSGTVEHKEVHSYQHRLARFLYPFYANIITTIGGLRSGFWEKHDKNVALEHSLSLLLTAVYFIILPTIITDGHFLWFLFLYLIYQCTLFYGIYVGAAINHFVPAAVKPIPKEHENKYGYYVCHNTTNFCISNRFWFWYTGGFNIQIEHHLIPFIPVENIHKLIPIVQELCKKYNYPYHNYTSFTQLWNDHYSYLSIFARGDQSPEVTTEIHNKRSYRAR